MVKYDVIETDQDRIELAKIIWTIYHLQDDDKKDVMDAVESNKQVYVLSGTLSVKCGWSERVQGEY